MRGMQGPSGRDFRPLRDELWSINHWWDGATTPHRSALEVDAAPMFHRADFFRMLEAFAAPAGAPSVWGVAGPAGVGKTTVLAQAIRLFTHDPLQQLLGAVGAAEPAAGRPSVQERHLAWAVNKYHNQQLGADAMTDLVNELPDRRPSDLLYLPLAMDPSYQITPIAQLRAAVDRYEREVLEGSPAQREHLIIIDDVHLCYPAAWAPLVVELLEGAPARRLETGGARPLHDRGLCWGLRTPHTRRTQGEVRGDDVKPMQ